MASINGTSAEDLIHGLNESDVIDGLEGHDTLFGELGNDTIYGREGNDELTGGAFDEYTAQFSLDQEADTLIGGTGNDTYFVSDNNDTVVEYAGEGTNDWMILALDEQGQNNVGFVQMADNVERFSVGFAVTSVNGANQSQIAVDVGGNASDNFIWGTGLNNLLSGAEGADTLLGAAGDDTLDGGVGKDSLNGGTGNDLYYVDQTEVSAGVYDVDLVTESANAGIDTVSTTSGIYTLPDNVENLTMTGKDGYGGMPGKGGRGIGNDLGNVITGRSVDDSSAGGLGSDLLEGLAGNDTLIGLMGRDTLDGGLGDDSMVGGVGDDTYRVDSGLDIVVELDDQGIDTVETSVEEFALPDFVENLTTSAEFGYGNDLDNVITSTKQLATELTTLEGGDGNDTLIGGGASDYLDGGDGDDSLFGGDGNDNLDGGIGNDTMVSSAGLDTLRGGIGDDVYIIDHAAAKVVEVQGSSNGYDTAYLSVTKYFGPGATNGEGLESIYLTGNANISTSGNSLNNLITGNVGSNSLNGNDGDDTLIGGGGADVLQGELGNDVFVVDSSDDVVIETLAVDATGVDLIMSSVSYSLDNTNTSGVETLELTGTDSINATGNDFYNLLIGNEANNVLDGLEGDDDLLGADGNDTLYGREGADILIGGAGNDALYGEADADQLVGDAGADTLTGGADGDVYFFSGNFEADIIVENDTGAVDLGQGINVDEANFQTISYNRLWLTQEGNDLRISEVGASNNVLITNWFAGNQYQIERVVAQSDGMVLNASNVSALVSAMAGFTPQDMSSSQTPSALLSARDQAWATL